MMTPPALGGLIARYSPSRSRIYALLVATPGRPWTVGELVSVLSVGQPTSPEVVRSALYVLASRGVVRTAASGHSLTFTLTAQGVEKLRGVLIDWHAGDIRLH